MKARILIVEDEEALTLLLRYNLEAEGYEIETVARGDEADLLLKESVPDLIILDWMLPGLSGIELCRRLRTLEQHARLPIALFSQGAYPEDITAGLSAGANYVLSKELLCEPSAWRRRLAEVLHTSRQQEIVE